MNKDKKIFFGLVRKRGIISTPDNFSEPEHELFLVNDSDNPITLKRMAYGGFKTYEDTVAMSTPQDDEVDIIIEPHSYVLYTELFEHSFEGGADQYQAIVEIEGNVKKLEFYTSRGAGFMGSLIPCLNRLGRVIHPQISDYTGEVSQ